MATQGKIKTLYSDINSEEALFPRTKTNAVSDQNGVGLDAILDKAVYTKSVNDNELNVVPVNADTLNGNNADYFASKSYVAAEIAKVQLDGEDVNIDLSGYATKDDLNNIDFPVDSVNGKTGTVTLSASDVGALPISGGTATGPVAVSGNSNTITMGTGANDVYIRNTTSNKYLQLKNDGTLSYDNKAIYHTGNKPTPADIGAAASSHNHAAGNITSGTLGVARGGTGAATHTANAVLTGNGTSAVKNIATASGALFATAANGAAKFGTLPIKQGGTGATAADAACVNLGLSPAMNIGTVYTTREKYKNKVVYAKAVSLDLGTGAGNKYVAIDGAMTELVSMDVYIQNTYLAYLPEYVNLVSVFMNMDSGAFFVNSAALSGYTAYAIIKYIK